MDKNNPEKQVDFYTEKDVLGLDIPNDQIQEQKNKIPGKEAPKTKKEDLYKDFEFPTLVTRVKALFVDFIILLIIFFTTAYLIDLFGGAPDWLRGSVLFFTLYIYEPILISTIGGTIGHYVLNIRIKSMKNSDKNIFIVFALVRVLLKVLLGWLSFLTVTFNKRRRAIHDICSGSIVIIHKTKIDL